MSIFDDFMTRFPQRIEPGENEYMGDDGLLYCSKCKAPVQCWVKIGSATRIVPCMVKGVKKWELIAIPANGLCWAKKSSIQQSAKHFTATPYTSLNRGF